MMAIALPNALSAWVTTEQQIATIAIATMIDHALKRVACRGSDMSDDLSASPFSGATANISAPLGVLSARALPITHRTFSLTTPPRPFKLISGRDEPAMRVLYFLTTVIVR
jgi:hypothetical protein